MRVLIVDDSEAFRRVMVEMLGRAGLSDICEADGFESALKAYKEKHPTLVFVDMVLPGRSGVELTRELLMYDPDARVIALSSIMNKTMIKESLDAGAKDFLLKPTNEMALNSLLSTWGD